MDTVIKRGVYVPPESQTVALSFDTSMCQASIEESQLPMILPEELLFGEEFII